MRGLELNVIEYVWFFIMEKEKKLMKQEFAHKLMSSKVLANRNIALLMVLQYLCYLAGFFLLFTIPVHAYIDPSVMTYAIQAVAGVAIGLGAFFGIYWRKIKRRINKYIDIESGNSIIESDEIYFDDPSSKSRKEALVHRDNSLIDNKKSSNFLQEFMPGILLALASSVLFLYAPLEIFFSNIADLWFDFPLIILPLLIAIIVSFIGLSFLLFVTYRINKKIYRFLIYLGHVLLITTFIQGNFLVESLPVLDGSKIIWSNYKLQMVESAALLVIISALYYLLIKKISLKSFVKLSSIFSLLMILIMSTVLIVTGIATNGFAKKDMMWLTSDKQYVMSQDKNLIVMIVDATDATYFKKVINEYPELKETFEDFTFFTNTLSAYPYTQTSVPFILGSQWINDDETLEDYAKRNIENSALLNELQNKDYEIGIYTPNIRMEKVDTSKFVNFQKVEYGIKKKGFLKNIYKLSWFKYAPFYLKNLVNVDMDMFTKLRINKNKRNNDFDTENLAFYQNMQRSSIEKTTAKQFKFIHFDGSHTPFQYDENLNLISTDDGDYKTAIRAAIKIVDTYLAMLKESGVYDNSAIIIMADHGYTVVDDPEHTAHISTDRQNPILLVKGLGESHELYYNDAPIDFTDLPECYSRLLDGAQSDSVFDAKEGESRERQYDYYNLNFSDYYEVQIQKGHASDDTTLEDTGVKLKRRR